MSESLRAGGAFKVQSLRRELGPLISGQWPLRSWQVWVMFWGVHRGDTWLKPRKCRTLQAWSAKLVDLYITKCY
jgi:hypothetical protein